MVDARFPSAWVFDKRINRLPPPAYKLFVQALGYSVHHRGEGFIPDDDLEDIPRVDPACAAELEKAGVWVRTGDGWLIVDYEKTQSSVAELEAIDRNRVLARERKAKQRARDKAEGESDQNRSRVTSRVTAQARQELGQARLGEAEELRDANQREDQSEWNDVKVRLPGEGFPGNGPGGDRDPEGMFELTADYDGGSGAYSR